MKVVSQSKEQYIRNRREHTTIGTISDPKSYQKRRWCFIYAASNMSLFAQKAKKSNMFSLFINRRREQ